MNRSTAAFAREALRHSVPTTTLRRLHASGLSVREIGRRVGLHPGTVHKRLARVGKRRRKNALARFTDAEKARAAHLYRSGLGLAYVTRFLQLRNKNAAARVLRSVGVEIRAQ